MVTVKTYTSHVILSLSLSVAGKQIGDLYLPLNQLTAWEKPQNCWKQIWNPEIYPRIVKCNSNPLTVKCCWVWQELQYVWGNSKHSRDFMTQRNKGGVEHELGNRMRDQHKITRSSELLYHLTDNIELQNNIYKGTKKKREKVVHLHNIHFYGNLILLGAYWIERSKKEG